MSWSGSRGRTGLLYRLGRALRRVVVTIITTLRGLGKLVGDMLVEAWHRGTSIAVATFAVITVAVWGTLHLIGVGANSSMSLLGAVGIIGASAAWSLYVSQPENGRTPPLSGDQQQDSASEATDSAASESDDEERFRTEVPDLDFDDVAGMDELKAELRDRVIDPLEYPWRYRQYGLTVDNGFLLYGPPGTGKTYISKALAGELDITYIEAKGADLISQWIGRGTNNVARLFEEARANQPVLLFIDELDALTPERCSRTQHHNQTQMINQFLEEISEVNEQEQDIVIVAATNRRDRIDDAMLRSGRLSVQIEVPPPGPEARFEIFDQHLDAPRAELDPQHIGELSSGLTAADMEQVATEAARNAMRRNGDVRMADIKDAIRQVS